MNRLALALSLAALTACKTGDMLRQKTSEAEQAQQDLQAERQRLAALEQKLKGVQAELTARESDVAAKQAEIDRRQAALDAAEARMRDLQASNQQLEVAKADLERKSAEYEQLAGSLKGEIEAGRVELTELRGRMTVKMKDKILFSSGSASIGKEGLRALQAVADALRNVQGKTIRVEGHTDNVPSHVSAFPTNWHLSAARALAVVRFLESAGVDPTKLAAAGYGEFQPVAPNDSPEGRSLNRRIEIVLAAGDGAK